MTVIRSSLISFLLFGIIIIVFPLVIFFSRQQQQTQQHAAAGGNTYYVSRNGNNTDGKSWQSAWSELGNINWSTILPGDTIILDGGINEMTYTTTLTIGKSGVQGLPITIQRATDSGHNGKVIVFGGRTIPLPFCNQSNYSNQTTGVLSSAIAVGRHSWIVIDGMSWHGISVYGFGEFGVDMSQNPSNDTLRNFEIYDIGRAVQSNGTWSPDTGGHAIYLTGSNHIFEQMDLHDVADDDFDGGEPNGPVHNITINRSWLHTIREDPNTQGLPFNECTHQDGYQIYDGGANQGPITIQNSIVGPGLGEGVILGATCYPQGAPCVRASVNNVIIKNSLFMNKDINIMGYPQVKESNWTIDHITVIGLNRGQWQGSYPTDVNLEGTGHSITNSIFYHGPFWLPDGLANSSGNCQWNTQGGSAIIGQTIDPQFVTDVSSYDVNTPLAAFANADYSLKSSSACAGTGSSITSVAQFLSMVKSNVFPTITQHNTPTPTPQIASSLPDGQGVYEGCAPYNGETACLNRLQQIAGGGFGLVMNYDALYATQAQILTYANKAHSLGMKIIWSMNAPAFWNGDIRSYYSSLASTCNCTDNAGFTRYFVSLVKTLPATWGYYVGDEVDPSNHDKVKAFTDIVKQADPNHTRLFIGSSPFASGIPTALSPFTDTADVLGTDYYPVGRTDIPDGINKTADIAKAVQTVADQNNKQSAMVLQAFNWGWGAPSNMSYLCQPFPSCVPTPTTDQMILMKNLTLQNATPRLILWYDYFDILRYDFTQWNNLVTAANAPQRSTIPTLSPSLPFTSVIPTIKPTDTLFSVILCPSGLGKCGDNTNPNSGGNTHPLHPQRNITLSIFDANNTKVGNQQGLVVYDAKAQNFQGTIKVPNVSSGNYIITLKMDGFLAKQIPGIVPVTQGQPVSLPSVSVVNGDMNNDNQLDIQDYNIFISCFRSKFATSSCRAPATSQTPGADIDDDGVVDGIDYNLFLRELSVQRGG